MFPPPKTHCHFGNYLSYGPKFFFGGRHVLCLIWGNFFFCKFYKRLILQAFEKKVAQKWAKNELSSDTDTLVRYGPFCQKSCLGNVLALFYWALTLINNQIQNWRKFWNFGKKSSNLAKNHYISHNQQNGANFCGKQTKLKNFKINWDFGCNRWVLIPKTASYLQNSYRCGWFTFYSFSGTYFFLVLLHP